MKKNIRYSLFVLLFLQMSGCTLEDIIERGEKCPPDGSDAVLSYIETPDCTKDACENASYQENFTDNICPLAFPKCVADDETLSSYHCAKDTLLVCDDGIICGTPEACIKPSDSKWCGASSCSEENYGGKKCDEDNGFHCVKSDDGWTCLRTNVGTIDCNGTQIYSSNDKTCGASSCDRENNYGGVDCTLKPNEFCKNAGNGFECTCKSGTVHCGDDCVKPGTDKKHCGASGTCSDDDPASENFKGVECGENQVCDCTGDNCGCIQNPCDIESMLYCTVDDSYECIAVTDEHHCGQCDIDCAVMKPENADFTECALNGSEYSCKFACSDGFANCSGDDSTLKCVDLKSDNDYCGDCSNRCGSKEKCVNGECADIKCGENVCQYKEDGEQKCYPDDDPLHCGPKCVNCKNIHESGICIQGECNYDSCPNGFHPVFSGTQITGCDENELTSCAPPAGLNSIMDCSAMEHIKSSKCNDAGYCEATECEDNYHLYDGQCEANDNQHCGTHENSCMTEGVASAACENGACIVSGCAPGYHLFESTCEADSAENCGGHGVVCAVENASNSCVNGTCQFTCNAQYHANGNTCEADSTANCGGYGVACAVENASNSCVNGVCQFTCNAQYHAYGNTCEADSTANCGGHGAACAVGNASNSCVNGVCQFTCNAQYHAYGNTCEADSTANCGGHGKNCVTGNIASANCVNGACQVTGCNGNYHVYNNTCEADDKNNCGAHGKSCMGANVADAVCENKTCRVTLCNRKYHILNNRTGCEANDSNREACAPPNMTPDEYKAMTGHSKCNDGGAASVCGDDGGCVCPNAGQIPNTNNTRCIPKSCDGLTGILTADWSDATHCKVGTCDGSLGYIDFIVSGIDYCRPPVGLGGGCTSMGYRNQYGNGTLCTAESQADCLDGYKYTGHLTCLREGVICGSNFENCYAQGKSCVNGKCQ